MDDILPSLLDRLADPTLPRDRPRYSLRAYEETVRRDLADLLNTHRPPDGFFAGLPECERSAANAGLRDVAGLDASSPAARRAFADHVRAVIAEFEPRLAGVEVDPRDPDEVAAADPRGVRSAAVHFRIRGTLVVDPAPVDGLVFDTVLELVTGKYDVNVGR